MPDQSEPVPLSSGWLRFCPACGARLGAAAPVACAACGATHWRNAKPCAGGLVVREGRLLLIRRARDPWAGHWDIPGGFCEADEHPEDAAVREVREETGLDIRITGFIGMWLDRYDDRDGGLPDTILGCYFDAEPIDGRDVVVDLEEVLEACWFPTADLPSEIAFPDHAWPVIDAWRARRRA